MTGKILHGKSVFRYVGFEIADVCLQEALVCFFLQEYLFLVLYVCREFIHSHKQTILTLQRFPDTAQIYYGIHQCHDETEYENRHNNPEIRGFNKPWGDNNGYLSTCSSPHARLVCGFYNETVVARRQIIVVYGMLVLYRIVPSLTISLKTVTEAYRTDTAKVESRNIQREASPFGQDDK